MSLVKRGSCFEVVTRPQSQLRGFGAKSDRWGDGGLKRGSQGHSHHGIICKKRDYQSTLWSAHSFCLLLYFPFLWFFGVILHEPHLVSSLYAVPLTYARMHVTLIGLPHYSVPKRKLPLPKCNPIDKMSVHSTISFGKYYCSGQRQ